MYQKQSKYQLARRTQIITFHTQKKIKRRRYLSYYEVKERNPQERSSLNLKKLIKLLPKRMGIRNPVKFSNNTTWKLNKKQQKLITKIEIKETYRQVTVK